MITKFMVRIHYKEIHHDPVIGTRFDDVTKFLNAAELTLLMNSYISGEEWLVIEDTDTSKKTKKKVGFAVKSELIRNIDIFPVLPKQSVSDAQEE